MWIDLAPYLDELGQMAGERHEQKKDYDSSNQWTRDHNPDYYGLLGEKVISILTGWPMDEKLRASGDSGYDFFDGTYRYDVKASSYWRNPHLVEFTGKELVADVFLLVAIDANFNRGRPAGWAYRWQLRDAFWPDFFGRGERLAFSIPQLSQMNQLGLPPWIKVVRP